MATPRISSSPYYRLSIPELSGGVNMRDGISLIQDNQLTDCRNVWYKNGTLRTRPGVMCDNHTDFEQDVVEFPEIADYKIYSNLKNFRVIDGITYFLTVFQYSNKLVFRYYSSPDHYFPVAIITEIPPEEFTCNIFQHNTDIYCFCSGYYENETTPYFIYKIVDKGEFDFAKPIRITDDLSAEDGGFYVPTVAVNCGTNGYCTGYDGGTMFEGYNLLGNKYKIYNSTVNKSRLKAKNTGEEQSHSMSYFFPFDKNALSLLPDLFAVTITDKDGKSTRHTVDMYDGKELSNSTVLFWESSAQDDGLCVMLFYVKEKQKLQIYFKKTPEVHVIENVFESDYLLNNMEIILPCVATKENYEKVLNMTVNDWYGGGTEGIYGGAHLFLAGNTKESEKALVVWSDLNKPLFFSENGYAYVGDKSQRVTAVEKQGESLIILKEREIYSTQYMSASTTIDAKNLENQSVVDITSAEVTFPMLQVHGFIGCDCPNTVQMCRNRLVWLHSDGKVYTLTNANQYNERSILEVSSMIERDLGAQAAASLRSALSADWEGNYVLVAGNRIYLMDYNSYGYANVSSYSKSDNAQLLIPWWIWDKPKYTHNTFIYDENVENRTVESLEKPIDIKAIVNVGNRLYMWALLEAACRGSGYFYLPELMYLEGNKDITPSFVVARNSYSMFYDRNKCEKNISSMLQTKFFDFGAPSIKKNVPKIEVTFGANGGVPINATVITEQGNDETNIVIQQPEAEEYSPQYYENHLIRPSSRANCRIGLKFESEGGLAVNAISLQYKQIGGLK